MPRNVKESDDEVETKGGRRTRTALNSSVLDSPLRRSTRIKHPTGQDVSSPESVSDVSSVGAMRTTRRRTTTGDPAIVEGARTLRVRRNSVASDISELTETESLPDGPSKRITRRSVAGISSVETPTKLNGRPRRTTRAGSETKSTPPVGRATRRTRATSMEPEIIEETKIRQVGTPVKSRKRASVMPSEPAVAEESDDGRSAGVGKTKEKTVYEVDEDESETSPQNTSTSSRQKLQNNADESNEKMEVDASPVKASEGDAIQRSIQESTEATTDVSDVSMKLEDAMKITNASDKSVAIDDTPELEKPPSPLKEPPMSGSNVEEVSGLNGEQNNDKQVSTRGSPVELHKDVETELANNKNEAESRVLESDNESDYNGYPAFKDILADEWAGAGAERMNKHNEDDNNSVHSVSTERNESECEIELVDNEAFQSFEKPIEHRREAKLDYDTDDTVITQVNTGTKVKEVDRVKEKTVVNDVTPMDLSSDLDADEDETLRSPKKQLSLSTSRKSIGANTSLINKNESPAPLNVSGRKSLVEADGELTMPDSSTNDDANVSVKSNKSLNKSPNKRNSSFVGRPERYDSSDSEEESEDSEFSTPTTALTANRKSVDASAKKLDTSKTNVSATTTPSNIETKVSRTPAKRHSSNKLASIDTVDDSDDVSTPRCLDRSPLSSESRVTQSEVHDDAEAAVKIVKASPQIIKEQLNRSVEAGSGASIANTSAREVGDIDLDSESDEELVNELAKRRSARKSASNRSVNKVTKLNSDSEIDDDDTSAKGNDELSKSQHAKMGKNNYYATQDSSNSEIDANNSKRFSVSPKIGKEKFDRSVKLGSAKKSTIDKNISKIAPVSTESPDISHGDLNKSVKSSSSNELLMNRDDSRFVQSDEDAELEEEPEFQSKLNKSNTKNSSKIAPASTDSDIDLKDSNNTPACPKIVVQDKLNKSSKSANFKKSSINKNNSKIVQTNSDSEADGEEVSQPKPIKTKIGSAKKLLIDADKNYSTIAQVNSDSEIMESSSSEEGINVSNLIPQCFFDRDSDSSSNSSVGNEDSSDTIDSDVARDLNLHGKYLEYSDDDVPADDCMATESDSSDSDDDGADLLDFVVDDEEESLGEAESSDSFNNVNEKIRKRIITKMDSDSESDKNAESQSSNHESDLDISTIAKTRKKDNKLNKSQDHSDSDENSKILTTSHKLDLDKSTTSKTPKKDKKKSQEIVEPEVQSTDFNVSAKAVSKKNKNLLLQSSTPKGAIRELSSVKTDNTPKVATPLSKSFKNADSSMHIEGSSISSAKKLSKSVCETVDTPTKLGSSFKVGKSPKVATPLSKSFKGADSSMHIEASSISSAKKLSKSVCETVDTPTKLGSSFKVGKSPKTPVISEQQQQLQTSASKKLSKSMRKTIDTPTKLGSSPKVVKSPKTPTTLVQQQLETSLPTDLMDTASKSNSSKPKSTKVSVLNQTMVTPNTDTSETRFLMKEKLNDSLPALKLQQKSKASRRSTLDNVCEEVAITEEIEEKIEKNGSIRKHEVTVETVVGSSEKKKKKKKKAATNVDTSKDREDESFATSKEAERRWNENESMECLEEDASHKISKKRNKKKKISEMEAQDPVESKVEEIPTNNKKKKRKENMEEVQVNDKPKKDKKSRVEAVDEIPSDEIIKKDKKKKKQDETIDEIPSDEIIKKDKKKKKRDETIDEIQTDGTNKKNKKRTNRETAEIVEVPVSKKKSVRVEEKTVASNLATDTREQQRKSKTRSVAANVEISKTNLKRLPDEILESLSDTTERPKKRRKIAKTEKIVPSKTMFDARHQPSSNLNVADGYISLSSSGGTTQFEVVNLKKATKKSKKTVAAVSFRERMLARNPRQPISAYLMYQQKQKVSGKDRPY